MDVTVVLMPMCGLIVVPALVRKHMVEGRGATAWHARVHLHIGMRPQHVRARTAFLLNLLNHGAWRFSARG